MKKFLLSIAAAALAMTASAGTVTFDFTADNYGLPNDQDTFVTIPTTITQDGVSLKLNGDADAWRYWSDGLRVYYKKNPTLTVTAPDNITKIEWTVNTGVKFSATSGGDGLTTWTGFADSVVLYGNVGSSNAALKTLTVTFDGEGGGTETPDPDEPGEGGGDQPGGDTPDQPGDDEEDSVSIVWSEQGYENAEDLVTFTQDGIKYSFSAGSNNNVPKYYNAGSAIRLYGGNSMTVEVEEGQLINKIVFTVGSGYPFNAASTANVGTFNTEDATWTSTEGARSVTFTQGGSTGHVRIEKMAIYLIEGTGGETPEQPEQPDQPEQPEGTITVAKALELIADGYEGNATVMGVISSITDMSNTDKGSAYGNATYLIKDALTDSDALTVYRGFWMNGDKFVTGTEIAVGGTVTVEGKLVNYNGTYEFTTGSKVVAYEAPEGGDQPGGETPEQPGDDDEDAVTIVWSEQGYENAEDLVTFSQDGITYSFSAGSNNNVPKYYNTGSAIRLYGSNSMTVEVEEGQLINKIVFTVGSNNPFNAESTANVGTFNTEDATWTSTEGARSVTFTQGGSTGHVRIEKMAIYLIEGTGGETPEQPEQPDQPEQPGDDDAETVTFNFADPTSLGLEIGEDVTEYDLTDETLTSGVISLLSEAAEGASTNPRLFESNGVWTYRFYKDNTITVSAQNGYLISKIEFNATNLNNASIAWSDNGIFSNGTWTSTSVPGVHSMSVTKTATGSNPAITSMTVYYVEDPETAVAEVIEAVDGEAVYYNLQGVRVANPERGIFVKVQNGKAVKVVK